MKQYLDLARYVIQNGTRKSNRTGVDTLSTFNYNYSIDLREGFPLLTTKKISWKNIVLENLWFLSGSEQIKLLREHGIKFWDPWADEHGNVPSAYGNFWRKFPTDNNSIQSSIDQVAWVVEQIKHNPMSRRHVISAWVPSNAHTSELPPCHLLWVFNVQMDQAGEPLLCLHLTQRSADVAIGVPYNIAGYAFLLELFAHLTGLRAGIFAHSLVDAHIYTSKPDGSQADYDHILGLEQQLQRSPRALPYLKIDPAIRTLEDVEKLFTANLETILDAFKLTGYKPYSTIHFNVVV